MRMGHNFEYFEIVETDTNQHLAKSGTCALCNNPYTFGNRVIAEYRESGGYLITEPFNLCDRCFQVQADKGGMSKQQTIGDYNGK